MGSQTSPGRHRTGVAPRSPRPQPTSPEDPGVRWRLSLLPRLTHLEEEGGGGREAAEPRGPGSGRSRGWSVAVSGARGNGGLGGGARALGWDRLGASRSPPAHVTAPKYPTHFLPNRTLTLQAGTRKIFSFFFSLPTPPPPSQPCSLLPLRPRSSLPCRLPLPGSLLGALEPGGGAGGGKGRGGAAQDAWVSAPPIRWASVAPAPGGRARLAEEVSVLGP